MKPHLETALAGLFSAAASVLTALANEFTVAPEAVTESLPAELPQPKTRKPRTTAPDKEFVTESTAPEDTKTPPEVPASNGEKSYEELKALIKPLVEEGRGEEVKKVIAKYSTGGLKMMEVQHHANFEKDITALSY